MPCCQDGAIALHRRALQCLCVGKLELHIVSLHCSCLTYCVLQQVRLGRPGAHRCSSRSPPQQPVSVDWLHRCVTTEPAVLLQVCAVLRQVPEEITVFGDDISSGHKRALLNALVETSPLVLGFLYTSLAQSFQAATKAAGMGDHQTAGEHVAVLRAVLGTSLLCLGHLTAVRLCPWSWASWHIPSKHLTRLLRDHQTAGEHVAVLRAVLGAVLLCSRI